jgi:hypothetical protein
MPGNASHARRAQRDLSGGLAEEKQSMQHRNNDSTYMRWLVLVRDKFLPT